MRVKGTCIRVTSLTTLIVSSFFSLSASLVIGILLLKNFDEYDQLSSGGDYAKVVAWVLIANSVVSMIDLLIGCYGLRFANNYLLTLYLVIGAILVTLEAGSSSFYFVASQNKYNLLAGHIHDELYTAVIYYEPETNQADLIDRLQYNEKCCGIDGYQDWRKYNTLWNQTAPDGQLAPETCCQIEYINDEFCNTKPEEINQGGCFEKLLDRHQHLATVALALCIASAVLEALCVVINWLYPMISSAVVVDSHVHPVLLGHTIFNSHICKVVLYEHRLSHTSLKNYLFSILIITYINPALYITYVYTYVPVLY